MPCLSFLMLSFKPSFSLSSFTFIKKLFSSCSLSAIRMISYVYLRLFIFLPEILIPSCASSRPASHMMYTAHKENKQGDNIQSLSTPFSVWNQSVALHLVVTVASWPVQISQQAGKVVWYSYLLKNFPPFVVITVKEFSKVNETEVDFFFPWNSIAFFMVQ